MTDATNVLSDTDLEDLDGLEADENGTIIEPEQSAQPQSAGALVVQDAITRMQSGQVNVYSTVVGDDFAAKLQVLTAVTNAVALAEHTGEHIDLTNIVIQPVELDQRDNNGNATGVKVTVPRVILIDENGTAYFGFSPVLLKGVETFLGVLGMPHTWPEPVGMKVVRGKAKIGTFYNLILDPRPKAAPAKK